VKDIAARLGYQSVHHFIKIFREKYGNTPKEYQKINV
jgi:AraC-like DNA-binding protein